MKKLFFLLLLLPLLARAQSPTNPTGPIQSTLYKDASGSFWTYIGGGKWFEQVPLQTGQNGKVLGTNGTTLSWVTGGGGGGAVWGSITGTLSNQTDLQTALNALVPKTTTVAGFALSSNVTLASLTATDGTLTFSGAYNGSTARTVGLNVNNSNTWNGSSGSQTFNSIVLNDLPTGSAVAAPTQGGSVLQVLDINNNSNANNFLPGFANPGTGGLIVSSPYIEYFTNSITTTCNLPAASSLQEGQSFLIIAAGTAAINVRTHGSIQIVQVPAGYAATMICILNSGTTIASWSYTLTPLNINYFVPVSNSGTANMFLESSGSSGASSWQIPTINMSTQVSGGILPVLNGGTGVSAAGLIAGTNITISGTWPDQTISASGGGGSYTAGNGLTLSGSHFILGGTMDSLNTQIVMNGKILQFAGNTNLAWYLNDATGEAYLNGGVSNISVIDLTDGGATLSYKAQQSLVFNGTSETVTDGTNLVGLVTPADYSTNQRKQPNAYITSKTGIALMDSVKATISGGITALTGDVTASGSGSVAATLATVNSNTGSFGSSTSIPSFTVNGKGLITAASGNAVIAPAGTLSGTTLNSTVVTSSLTAVGTIATGVWQGTAIANTYLANSSITVNGTSIALGASGTVTAAAGTLTGTTLNSTVVSSSLTSVGTLSAGSIPYSLLTGTPSLSGYLTAIGVSTANGVSGTSSGGTTPNLTITLGKITPTSINTTIIPATIYQTAAGTAGTDSLMVKHSGGIVDAISPTAYSPTVATDVETSLTSNKTLITYAVGSASKMFRVSSGVNQKSGTGTVVENIQWTDTSNTVNNTSFTSSGGGVGGNVGTPYDIYCKNGTNIVVSVVFTGTSSVDINTAIQLLN